MIRTGLNGMQRIFLCLAMALEMALSGCETTDGGAVMALEGEGPDNKHLVRKIIGGLVTRIAQNPRTHKVSLSIRETRVGSDGSPLCSSPTGRVLDVESVVKVFFEDPKRLKSALVVMENPADPTPRDLKVGECVSVAPDDVDRVQTIGSSIEIDSAPVAKNTRDSYRDGIVGLWAASFSRKSPAGLFRPGSSPARGVGAASRSPWKKVLSPLRRSA